jgi:protein-disulfide isomerase
MCGAPTRSSTMRRSRRCIRGEGPGAVVAFDGAARPSFWWEEGRAGRRDGGGYGILSSEEKTLFRLRFLAGLLIAGLAVGCKAQNAQHSTGPDPAVDRRIEVLVRNQYSLPEDVHISIGARQPSQFTGYDTLPVTLTHDAKSQVVNFLISDDGGKLIQMTTLDLTKDPADAVPIDGRPIRGNPNAKVTVINFDDLECPYCARMHEELFPATINHYKDLVRYVYKDDPLTELHPWAMHAAVDANCLAAQSGDVYWTYVDYLHAHGEEVTGADREVAKSYAALDRIARQEATLGKLDGAKLDACLAKQDESQVKASLKLAEDLNLDGTPAVIVNGEHVNGGAVPQDELWMAIDRALRAAGEQPPANPAAAAQAAGTPVAQAPVTPAAQK